MNQAKARVSIIFLFLILALAPDSKAWEPRIITGVIKDYLTRKPLTGMAVQLGTSIAITDKKGKFTISFPDTVIDIHPILRVSYTTGSGTAPKNTIIPDYPIGNGIKDEIVIFRYPHASLCNPVTTTAYRMFAYQQHKEVNPKVYQRKIIKPIINYIPPLPVADYSLPKNSVSTWAKFKYLFHKHNRHYEK